jgi:hypothetical protein
MLLRADADGEIGCRFPGMVDFLDALTEQAQANNMEPAGKGKKKKAAAADDGDGEGVAVGEDGEPLLVSMLRIIKDRVIAEIRTRDKPYVRMLAVLLRIDDTAEREALLRSTVLTADAAEMFEKFTLDGIQVCCKLVEFRVAKEEEFFGKSVGGEKVESRYAAKFWSFG